jgi:predicted GIY-YIG superfamily endonuclease
MEENRKVYIYGLIDPRNDKVFYAGFTNNIKRRYNSHMNINGKKREKNTHKDNVIKKIFALGDRKSVV